MYNASLSGQFSQELGGRREILREGRYIQTYPPLVGGQHLLPHEHYKAHPTVCVTSVTRVHFGFQFGKSTCRDSC